MRTLARFDTVLASSPAVGCADARLLRSAAQDGELEAASEALLARHDAACAPCSAGRATAGVAWQALDLALAAIPPSVPSARVDAHVARLVAGARGRAAAGRPRLAGGLLAGAGTIGLVLALLSTQVLAPGPMRDGGPVAQREAVLVAGAQQVFDERTNTLYVLRPADGTVDAVDNATQLVIATVRVGGRPTALALDAARSTVYVLDSERRSVTEIDTLAKAVVGTVALTLPGTPTTISVDSAKGKLVIGAVASPAPSAAPSVAPVGHVTVLDLTTKRVDTVRVLDVAPQSVVLDGAGRRALIVSPASTRVVDATTYASLEDLGGGVAAAFSTDDRRIAILGAGARGSVLRLSDGSASNTITFAGVPLALISLPDGAFAALVQLDGKGRIHVIGADGAERGSSEVDPQARDLAYDARQARVAIVGPAGASYVSLIGAAIAAAAPSSAPPASAPPARPSPSVAPSPAPAAASAPASSAPPSAPASAPPSAAPASAAPKAALAAPARQVWPGTYFVDLGSGGRRLVAGSAGRVWTSAAGLIAEVDTATGAFTRTFPLPATARISSLHVGSRYVFAADTEAGRLHVVSLADGELSDRALPFLRAAVAVAVSGDDRLWLAVAQSSQLIVYDAAARRVEAVDVRASSISALVADRAGRLWFSDDVRRTLSSYDIAKGRVTDLAVRHRGTVTALLADTAGTVWLGTDAGEVIGIRDAAVVAEAAVGRPIRALTQGPGRAWYLAEGPEGSRIGPADSSGPAAVLPPGLRGLAFDARGLAWSAAPIQAGGFYIVDTAGP